MVKPQAAQHTAKIEREDEHILGQAEVQPGHIEIISLGMYEQGMPEPTLTLELKPNLPDAISASLARLDENDHYTLIYQVHNFGDVACLVRVKAKS
jgi:hypothetical protein